MILLLWSLLLSPPMASLEAAETKDSAPTICQFHLSTKPTGTEIRLNSELRGKGVVKNFYMDKEGIGKDSFEKMINSGTQCDGLILSGHHVGDFTARNNRLFLKNLEELSCNKKHKKWFDNIKSLWLLGCNTSSDGYLKPVRQGETRNRTVNAETGRVLESVFKSDVFLLQQSYTASLNEFTPFGSRYLRMFPHSQIYGFGSASPESKQISDQRMIRGHIQNIATEIKKENTELSRKESLIQSLNSLLGYGNSEIYCDNDDKIEAWENKNIHANARGIENQDYSDVYKLGCELIRGKQILENPKSSNQEKKDAKRKILKTLKDINKLDKTVPETGLKYSHLLFKNIYETWSLSKQDTRFYKKLKKELKNKSFVQSLKEQIKSPIAGSTVKIDYLNFYAEIKNVDIKKEPEGEKKDFHFVKNHVEKIIQNNFSNLINVRSGHSIRKETKNLLKIATFDQLSQYQLLTNQQARKTSSLLEKIIQRDPNNIYAKQIQYKLQYKLSNPDKVLSKLEIDLNNETLNNENKKIPLFLALKEFIQKDSLEELSIVTSLLGEEKHQSLRKPAIKIMARSISNFQPDNPKKQADKLLSYAYTKDHHLSSYALAIVGIKINENVRTEVFKELNCKKVNQQFEGMCIDLKACNKKEFGKEHCFDSIINPKPSA